MKGYDMLVSLVKVVFLLALAFWIGRWSGRKSFRLKQLRVRESWLIIGACTATSISAVIAASAPFLTKYNFYTQGYWDFVAAFAVPSLLGVSWGLRKLRAKKVSERSAHDFDSLIAATEKAHFRLGDLATESPDSTFSKFYIETILDDLRRLLEPENSDSMVRICVYRVDSGEAPLSSDGPEETMQTGKEADLFLQRYLFVRGNRTDKPRGSFSTLEMPGQFFLPMVLKKGQFICQDISSLEQAKSDEYYSPAKDRAYRSFVDTALLDDNGEILSLLTCDSTQEDFFDERRLRIIRSFIPLVKMALTESVRGVPNPEKPKS